MKIDIRDGIPDAIAVECVLNVVKNGKISKGEHGKKYYCWITVLETPVGMVVVSTRQYRKGDCFVVYKYREDDEG
jgi:hypothetical protein